MFKVINFPIPDKLTQFNCTSNMKVQAMAIVALC